MLGQPELLVTDRGQNFRSVRMFETCVRYGIKQIFVLAEVHKAAGRIERYHATLKDKLRRLLVEKHFTVKQWDQVLQESVRLIQVTPNRTIQCIPVEVLRRLDEQGNELFHFRHGRIW